MSELDLNKPAGVLVKTTCVDFPGRVAGSFFLKGCNIRCPYCYNIGLVLTDSEMPSGIETEPLSRQRCLLERDVVGALPFAVLRGDGIDDGAFREVLHRAVGGHDGGTVGNLEVQGNLRRQREQRPHGEDNVRHGRADLFLPHFRGLVEVLLILCAFYPCTLNVALLARGLVLDA